MGHRLPGRIGQQPVDDRAADDVRPERLARVGVSCGVGVDQCEVCPASEHRVQSGLMLARVVAGPERLVEVDHLAVRRAQALELDHVRDVVERGVEAEVVAAERIVRQERDRSAAGAGADLGGGGAERR